MPPKRKPARETAAPQNSSPSVPTISQNSVKLNAAPQSLLKTPYNTSSTTISQHPPKAFQFDNAVPQSFDTSMFPPCLRPLVHYEFDEAGLTSSHDAFFEPFPFTAEHVMFIFTELIENDLYSNVSTQDWISLVARLNTQFLTKFDFQDVRHFALRVLLHGYTTWLHGFQGYEPTTTSTPTVFSLASRCYSPPLALIGFYYNGVLLHSAIKEGAFDVLSSSRLIFPDPIYEFHLDTGFIPPTRRTVHGVNGNVSIHNPTQLSTAFQPSLHANNPNWPHTNHPNLYTSHPNHPAHSNIPFVPNSQQSRSALPSLTRDQPIVFHNLQQQPQQHITITNTSPNPTSGMSVWGSVSVPQISDPSERFTIQSNQTNTSTTQFSFHGPNPIDTYKVYLHALTHKTGHNIPKSFLTEKLVDVHVIDLSITQNTTSSRHTGAFVNPYDHLSTSIATTVKVHQINKFINNPALIPLRLMLPSLNSAPATDQQQLATYGTIFARNNPKATILRNNYAVKTTFSRSWIRTHVDRYGDFAAYLSDQITKFNMYMYKHYPQHYHESYYASHSLDIAVEPYITTTLHRSTTTTAAPPTSPPLSEGSELQPGLYNAQLNPSPSSVSSISKEFPRPFDAFKFEHWSNDIHLIPDCVSLRQFSTAHRKAQNIRITPTQSWADIVPSLNQPVIDGILAAENPINTPLRHPLHKQRSTFPPLTAEEERNLELTSTPARPELKARRDLTVVLPSTGVWGYFDDGFYTNNSMVYSIRPPEPPPSLLPSDLTLLDNLQSRHPSGLPAHLLLHHEEQRFYFILQQKLALYFTRRALRRVYLDLFYRDSTRTLTGELSSLNSTYQESQLQIIVMGTLPLLATLYSPHPQLLARQNMLKQKWDNRILIAYDDILLKLTHYADLKTEIGLNMQLASRFNQSTYLRLLFSPAMTSVINQFVQQVKQFAIPSPSLRFNLSSQADFSFPAGFRGDKPTLFAPAWNAIIPTLPHFATYFTSLASAGDTEYLNYQPGSREQSKYLAELKTSEITFSQLGHIFFALLNSHNRDVQQRSTNPTSYHYGYQPTVTNFSDLFPPSALVQQEISIVRRNHPQTFTSFVYNSPDNRIAQHTSQSTTTSNYTSDMAAIVNAAGIRIQSWGHRGHLHNNHDSDHDSHDGNHDRDRCSLM
jgi:hypothetical protein